MPRKKTDGKVRKNRLYGAAIKIIQGMLKETVGSPAVKVQTVFSIIKKRNAAQGFPIKYSNGNIVKYSSVKYLMDKLITDQQHEADGALSDEFNESDAHHLAEQMSAKVGAKLELKDISYNSLIERLQHNGNVLAQLSNYFFREANRLEQLEVQNKFSGSGDMFKLVSDFISNLSDEEKEEVAFNVQV